MKKILLILFILSVTTIGTSKEKSIFSFAFAKNTKTYTFGNNVRIRKSPTTKKRNVIAKLSIGHKVTVLKKSKTKLTLNNISDYWYKIKFKNKGKTKVGYIWGSLLAIGFEKYNNKILLIGHTDYNSKVGIMAECRLVKNKKLISKIIFEPHSNQQGSKTFEIAYTTGTELFKNRGLKSFDNILKISFDAEACGYTYGSVWIGIKNNSFFFIHKDSNVSESGAFRFEEKLIFPNDVGGIKNKIIISEENFTFDEKTNKYITKKKTLNTYYWSKKKLNKVK